MAMPLSIDAKMMTRRDAVPAAQRERILRDEPVFLFIVCAWICAVLYFDPRLLALTYAAPDLLAKACIVIFVACLNSFWLYAIYNSTMIAVSFWLRRKPAELCLPAVLTEHPKTAILYTTRNDFREESAESCVNLDYPDFHVFILDDSDLSSYRDQIDRWAQSRAQVTVIRRPSHDGFKAGNLNYALNQIKEEYPYFAVCDADGILPAEFVAKLMPFFYSDEKIAFVQAAQEANPRQKEAFGRAMAYMVVQHYRHFVRAKNRFGFVMFYGHGALLKTCAWKDAGGFPEIVTEDLAFAAKVRELGYHGQYTELVHCYEDFPPDYDRFRIRTEKWIRGTSEFMKTGFSSFFRSPRVPWFEKLDVMIGAFSHYQTALMLLFLLVLGTLLPTYYAHFRYPGSFFLMPVPQGKSAFEYLIHIRYHIFWSLDFYLMMALTFLVPVVPAVLDLRKKPAELLRYLALSNFIYMASLVTETAAVLTFLFTGRAVFRNTHDGSAKPSASGKNGGFHPNQTSLFFTEFFMALLLLYLGFQTKNLWFLAPASALFLSPLVHRFGWKGWMRPAAALPMAIGVVIFSLVSLDLLMTWINKI